MSAKRDGKSKAYSFVARDSTPPPSGEREASGRESEEAFEIVVTLRESLEAADSLERRIGGMSDPRYTLFLTKTRDRHLQIVDTARRLLVDMAATMMPGEQTRRTLVPARRSGA